MRYKGRRWNNILILSVIVFIAVLNLPTIIKTFLIDSPSKEYPRVLDASQQVVALYSSDWSLIYHNGDWQSTPRLSISALELVQNWKNLVGTTVSQETYKALKSKLSAPYTIEIWYSGLEEPQRITYYYSPKFWLFKNWQNQWIAVTADKSYLFPSAQP